MGTGSSKSTAQTSLTMANTARLSLVNNVHDAGFVDEVNPDRNGEGKDFSVNSTSALALFSEKHPEIAPTLNTTKDHYHALKDAQNDGNLISLAAFQHVKGLYDVYIQDKSRKNRGALTEFAVALGIPKLAYEVIVDIRTKYQELTTWDREKDTEESKGELPVSTEEKKRFDFAVKYQTLTTWDREKDTEGRKGELAVRTEEQESEQDKAKNDVLKMSQDITAQLVAALLNFTDVHDPFCLACNEAGMVPLFVEMIKELQDTIRLNVKFVNPQTQHLSRFTVRGKILSRTLGILHNLSKRVPTRRNFAACQAVSVLVPLLKAEAALYSAKALLILAYLIDEENNHLIMADKGPIKFLTSLLERSLKASSHRYIGFSSSELAEGLTQIAVNDSNKKTIAQCGAIPILIKMLQSAQDDEEKFNACNTLWTLAFDEENRQQIKSDNVVIPELKKLLASENSEIKRAAAGALWECEGKEKHAEEKQQSVKVQEAIGVHVQDTKHVMISYQWDVQTLVIQLKNRLQADGYKVWMDIDEMGGSTLESMAKAVENASVVLVCVSQKYKESPNCRSEAEYTFQLQKDVIPLMMESKYRPDGWLGFIVGSKFWIDFSEKHKLDMNANKLLKELGNRGKITVQEPIVQEAEYTFQLQKDVIPLMMESKYRPDGWLGFIVGSKFWIDFSEKHKLDMNANKLLKELGNRGKITVQEPIVQAVEEDVVDASPEFSIRSWSRNDVKSWIKDVGLDDRLNKKAVDRLDGRMLLRLQDLRKESPEFFYSSIKTDLGLSNVFDVLEFVDELDKLQE